MSRWRWAFFAAQLVIAGINVWWSFETQQNVAVIQRNVDEVTRNAARLAEDNRRLRLAAALCPDSRPRYVRGVHPAGWR